MFKRFIAISVIITLISGCSSAYYVHFDSTPVGATVQFAGSTCTTPCKLPLANTDVQLAQVSFAGREPKLVRVEGAPSVSARVGHGVSSATATTLGYLAIPLLAVGGFGLILFSGNETDGFYNSDYQYDRGGFYITMGALVSGATLMWASKSMKDFSADLYERQDVYVALDLPEAKREDKHKPTLSVDDFIGHRPFPVTGR
ncbi:hypothetical protein Geob_2721 [Geotalea daltonii FRC-32]|uniref:PEGA domain-containing protein n=1 Tax=Geotalea daltonii (strain DSM 22248 / JCM 15807 / FRC-32) TaxID=316067 RepID=B9M1I9_GEODF|nr:hypothetical protein [Geotalea daltonii]ACM21071.1 hypothetical protein Geob_2721 [Geotalea daltonii FRC-32]